MINDAYHEAQHLQSKCTHCEELHDDNEIEVFVKKTGARETKVLLCKECMEAIELYDDGIEDYLNELIEPARNHVSKIIIDRSARNAS